MIDRREILSIAQQTSLTPHVIEKDYVLGWMLAGIYAHDELADSWLFKGGTCLKKCFFETYRFSEDLDFTLRNEAHLDEAFLKGVFVSAAVCSHLVSSPDCRHPGAPWATKWHRFPKNQLKRPGSAYQV